MSRRLLSSVAVIVLCVATLDIALPGGHRATGGALAVALAASPHQSPDYAAIPLHFEPNRGQAPATVRYLAHGAGYTVALTDTGALLGLSQSTVPLHRPGMKPVAHAGTLRQTTLRLVPVGANPHPRLAAQQKLPGIVNYFIGNDPKRWHTDIPTYAQVTYHGVYPGIDLTFYGRGGVLEYDWLIHAHASPAAIAMTIGGARSVRLDRSGNLLLGTSLGLIRQQAPHVFQMRNGQRIAVDGGYRLAGRTRVSFRLARYDHAQPLVIDPVLAFGTYLGDSTVANGVAFDGSGDAYLTGRVTGSIPVSNAYQSQSAGSPDAFVTKLNPSGSDLVYSTYLGGANSDIGNAIAVDGSGSAYITGFTYSGDFPGLPGVASPTANAAFVVKLSPAGSTIVYAHGYPNGYSVSGTGIAVDGAGDAFYTANLGTPAGNAVKSYAVVNELAPDGSLLHSSGASGSSGYTNASGVALDGQGNIYVAGSTNAPDFYVSNALQPRLAGGYDAFLIKLDSGFNRVYSTFLGGGTCNITVPFCGEDDFANGVAVDASGNVYVAGSTTSAYFPTASPLQSSFAGKQDGFVTELNPPGTAFVYSTYLGGHETGVESLNAIAVDGAGNAYVTGETTAADYPTVNPLPGSGFKGNDAVVTEIAAGGQSLIYSTFLSGAGANLGTAIALDAAGNAYVAGLTTAIDFPISPSAFQQSESGRYSAFAVKLAPPPPPGSTSTPTPTATATRTPTATPNATLLYTPPPITVTPPVTATRTSTPIPGLTVVTTPLPPPATPTSTAGSPTAASTPISRITPIPTRISSRRRPPATPQIRVKPYTRDYVYGLTVSVFTSRYAKVSITIQAKRGRTFLIHIVTAARQVRSNGGLLLSIPIAYNPQTQVRVLVTAVARNAAGTTANSVYFTYLHHRP
jgi:Beta-propeller repeat